MYQSLALETNCNNSQGYEKYSLIFEHSQKHIVVGTYV